MTYLDLVREVGAEFGVTGLADQVCDHVLWEHTPYPLMTHPDSLRPFLEKFFEGNDDA